MKNAVQGARAVGEIYRESLDCARKFENKVADYGKDMVIEDETGRKKDKPGI